MKYIKVNYEVDNSTMIVEENIPSLRKYTLEYLGVKDHDICNISLNGSQKSCVCVTETEQMIRQIGGNANIR